MPTAVILAGAALLVLGVLMASRRGGRHRPDGTAGAATYTDGSTGDDCADGGGSDGGCGGGGSGGD